MRIPAQIHTYEGARPRALPEGLGFPVEKIEDGAYPPAVAVGILDGPGREIGFGHGESQLTVILPDIGDCARFVDSCKALGGKVPLGTYGGELVSAMARELEREESAPRH